MYLFKVDPGWGMCCWLSLWARRSLWARGGVLFNVAPWLGGMCCWLSLWALGVFFRCIARLVGACTCWQNSPFGLGGRMWARWGVFFKIAPGCGACVADCRCGLGGVYCSNSSPLVDTCAAGCRCGLDGRCGLLGVYFSYIAPWSGHVLLGTRCGLGRSLWARGVSTFHCSPLVWGMCCWLWLWARTVAVGSRGVFFRIAPVVGACYAGLWLWA